MVSDWVATTSVIGSTRQSDRGHHDHHRLWTDGRTDAVDGWCRVDEWNLYQIPLQRRWVAADAAALIWLYNTTHQRRHENMMYSHDDRHDFTHQKSLESVNSSQSYLKKIRWTFLGLSVERSYCRSKSMSLRCIINQYYLTWAPAGFFKEWAMRGLKDGSPPGVQGQSQPRCGEADNIYSK